MTSESLFDVLPEEARRALLASARRRRFGRGEVVFHEGDPGDSLHVIEKGHVAIRVSTPLGDVLTLVLLGPGEAFGEQALLGSPHRTASAVAVEGAETRVVLGDQFAELRRENPAVTELLVEVLAAQVRRLSSHLLEALYVPAESRILRRLCNVTDSYASDDASPVVVPVTQQELAAMAGTTRPTVNRVLQSLQDDGIVELGRGRTTVLDPDRLRKAAG
ncbi:MAG TPA: Crp/Fnr family transcriptional regulator [Acidimicrobiales bacterium]